MVVSTCYPYCGRTAPRAYYQFAPFSYPHELVLVRSQAGRAGFATHISKEVAFELTSEAAFELTSGRLS